MDPDMVSGESDDDLGVTNEIVTGSIKENASQEYVLRDTV